MTDAVTTAYGRRADEYADALGTMEAVHPSDRSLVETWADTVTGRIIDLGCGPGHWTAHLHKRGHRMTGVDPARDFIERARREFPDVDFALGETSTLRVDGDVAGVLAWYSLIHLSPDDAGRAVTQIHDALEPGGRLLIGFFTGERLEQFDHAVAPAWFWPTARVTDCLERRGFTVDEVHTRTSGVHRPHGAVVARRLGTGPTRPA